MRAAGKDDAAPVLQIGDFIAEQQFEAPAESWAHPQRSPEGLRHLILHLQLLFLNPGFSR